MNRHRPRRRRPKTHVRKNPPRAKKPRLGFFFVRLNSRRKNCFASRGTASGKLPCGYELASGCAVAPNSELRVYTGKPTLSDLHGSQGIIFYPSLGNRSLADTFGIESAQLVVVLGHMAAGATPVLGQLMALAVVLDGDSPTEMRVLAAVGLGISAIGPAMRAASALERAMINEAVVGGQLNAPMAQAQLLASSSGARILVLDASRFPVSAANQAEAAANGARNILIVNRAGAAGNREAALEGLPKIPGFDLDEAPPAFVRQQGDIVIVRPTPPGDNRGAGASLGNQARGVPDGGRVIIIITNGGRGG
ncbi:MAG: hypothetical protein ACREF9_13820 [Opitutaceae bacterium]